MPTRYFAASVDQNWDTLGNWWADAACTEGFSGTLTGVNVIDTDTEVTCDSTAGLVVGRPITGDGIDTGTTVASITDGTTFELSQAAISTETSDLTCELHVIPVTADDVVIATGNGTVVALPSADVLGLVTVNGDSVLDVGMWPSVGLSAASFEFNDTSYNSGYIAGNCTFNDSSANFEGNIDGNCTFNDSSYSYGSITGDCTFNDTSSTTLYVAGDCTFNDSSYNNWGSIAGDCTFNGSSYNGSSSASITGDCTFNDSSYNDGTITGEVAFNGNSRNGNNSPVVNGIVNGDFEWYSSNYNYGTINGDCVGGVVNNGYPGVINGNCTVASGGTVYFNEGTINGDCDFLDGGYSFGSSAVITGNVTFSGSSYGGMDGGTINGDVTFNDSTVMENNSTITGTVTFNNSTQKTGGYIYGNPTFNDYSVYVWGGSGSGTIFGDPTFNDNTSCSGDITGNVTLNDNAYYSGDTTGNVSFTMTTFTSDPLHSIYGGYVSGTVDFPNGATFTVAYSSVWTTDASYWTGTLAWEFNDTSYNATGGNLSGVATFNDSSYSSGTITGNCTFNDSSYSNGNITSNPTFNDTSYHAGTITGNATFNDTSYVDDNGIITGNASFTNTAFSYATTGFSNPQQGSVSGTVDFPNGATFTLAYNHSWWTNTSTWTGTLAWVFTEYSNTAPYGSVSGTITFNDSSYHGGGGISGNVTFNDSSHSSSNFNPGGSVTFNDGSYNNYSCEIQGNCTFNDSSYNTGTITGNASFTNTSFSTAQNYFLNPQQGYVSGTVDFPNGATFTLANSEQWTVDASYWTGTLAWVFNDYSTHNYNGTITGNATFNDSSFSHGTITGDPTFNDTSGSTSSITGNVTFNDASYNAGNVTGTVTFNNTVFPPAQPNGYNSYPFNPQQGTVSGTVSFPNGATFTLAGSESWTTDASYWTGTLAWVFNDTSTNNSTITGDCIFNGSGPGTASGSVIVGNCTFNGSKYHGNGTITGNVSFRESSYNGASGITGNVTFYDSSYNGYTITGNGIIRQHAAAFVAWRDYATSTYITGTLTLQFPEMDILGTGLL
jgi:hypothetical protein